MKSGVITFLYYQRSSIKSKHIKTTWNY